MIAAARAVLDLTEHLIDDPAPLLAVIADLAAAGRATVRHDREGVVDEAAAPSRPRVQHIRVS